MTRPNESELREQVRARYAAAATEATSTATASCCAPADPAAGGGSSCCGEAPSVGQIDEAFGGALYDPDSRSAIPAEAVAASLGCGNPLAVADLRPGERVLDLGSGGGIDVLLSARRVGPTGYVYGLDMTDEMLDLARTNAAKAEATNVEFVKGTIEAIPLADAAVDVIISNCVINLSVDKPTVLAEMYRVLRPGGRLGISDVVADDHLTSDDRAERGSFVGCIAGALSRREFLDGLTEVGFEDPSVTFTHEVAEGMHGAIIRASKPAASSTHPKDSTGGGVIRVFEPALCCNTGVCGPDLDEKLVRFTADLAYLTEHGADIRRHNLANDAQAFAADPTVRAFLEVAGSEGLPLTLVDGVTVQTGSYPSRTQLMRYAGLADADAETGAPLLPEGARVLDVVEDEAGGCCGSSACCGGAA
jgi:SAM-dependent methyltransferase